MTSVMESVFFFPIILPMAIVAIVWGMLLNTDMGVINGLLTTVGLGKVPWLTDPRFSLMTVIILDVWKGVGFFFIIYLVALRNVPKDLYEAAEIDGAGKSKKFFFHYPASNFSNHSLPNHSGGDRFSAGV